MMTHRKSGLLFVAAILSVGLVLATRYSMSAQDAGKDKSKIMLLLEERRDTLQVRVEMVKKLADATRSTPEALIAAHEDLINAEIEMATNSKERVAAFQRKIENAKEFENVMEQRNRDGKGTGADVLMAKAARLGAEIELQREIELQGKH